MVHLLTFSLEGIRLIHPHVYIEVFLFIFSLFFYLFIFFLHLFAAIFILNLIYFSYISNIHSVLKVKKSFVGYAEILILTPFSLGRSINFCYNEYRFDAFLTFFFLVSGFDSFVSSVSMSLSLPLFLSLSLSPSLSISLSLSQFYPLSLSLLLFFLFYSKNSCLSQHLFMFFPSPVSNIHHTHTYTHSLKNFLPIFSNLPKPPNLSSPYTSPSLSYSPLPLLIFPF